MSTLNPEAREFLPNSFRSQERESYQDSRTLPGTECIGYPPNGKKYYECNGCQGMLNKPMLFDCGHVFCHFCCSGFRCAICFELDIEEERIELLIQLAKAFLDWCNGEENLRSPQRCFWCKSVYHWKACPYDPMNRRYIKPRQQLEYLCLKAACELLPDIQYVTTM